MCVDVCIHVQACEYMYTRAGMYIHVYMYVCVFCLFFRMKNTLPKNQTQYQNQKNKLRHNQILSLGQKFNILLSLIMLYISLVFLVYHDIHIILLFLSSA